MQKKPYSSIDIQPLNVQPECAGRAKEEEDPWYIGFQMNERYLKWGESGQARFLKLHCAKELGWSQERVRCYSISLRSQNLKASKVSYGLGFACMTSSRQCYSVEAKEQVKNSIIGFVLQHAVVCCCV